MGIFSTPGDGEYDIAFVGKIWVVVRYSEQKRKVVK